MKTLKVLGILFLVLVSYLWWSYPSGTWNYRLTVAIETPDGIKTGSVVRELTVITYPRLTSEMHAHTELKGEAIAIDLGGLGTNDILFALLRSNQSVDHAKNVFFRSFPLPLDRLVRGSTTPAGVRYYNSLKEGKADLSSELLPMLVRFKDINDPKTVELVDPADLAATYGKGYKLHVATIEITDDPVTTGIEKVLPWLAERLGWAPTDKDLTGYLGGWPNDPTKLYLTGSEFSYGVKP